MNKFKIFGLIATGVGFVATLLGNWASEKQQEELIDEKINKKLEEKASSE